MTRRIESIRWYYVLLTNAKYVVLTTILCTAIVTIAIFLMTAIEAPSIYAHTFSQNENSVFLTRINQIQSQLQLIQNILSNKTDSSNNNINNIKFVQAHAMEAIALLNQKDPASNFTWNQEIAERNQRIARDLTRGLNDLISLNQHITTASNGSRSSLNGSNLDTQDKINDLGGLLKEAVSARVQKSIVNNSTNQALVLANLGNEIFYSYGKAIGFPQAKLSNMIATMNIAHADNNPNMNKNQSSTKTNEPTAAGKKVNISDQSEYQNAQAYVKQAQEIVSKYLKYPIS
ncbi:MAG TPA: hypothetical protein VH500_06540, partial [Nitrososphaeraceae archaeon]